ncbi:acyltransferase [Algibacter mikhailovii]|uniref:Acyltransferase n=1 Tax=Algibacter mikhailovii TaxID=425498 RepID=A0A918RDS9_9FLAO|nr:acyltransferase [Algibacter mikhailovii]GGZ93590.1 hypothetical protein GCM10007028_35000 [Algibacter mikhailovii]
MKKLWNGKLTGIIGALFILFDIIYNRIFNYLFFIIHKGNLNTVGKGTLFYRNLIYRFPKTINLGENCIINRNVTFGTELEDAKLKIGNNVSISTDVSIDYTGNLEISNHVTISKCVSIFTHDHGLDPRSMPQRKPLTIGENVWIGSHAVILHNVDFIGDNSIIAAGSIVTKNIESKSIVGGNPAKFIKAI